MNIPITKTTLWVNRFLALVMILLIPGLPAFVRWYAGLRPFLSGAARTALLAGFYCSAPAVFLALWKLDVLLRNILARRVFEEANVAAIAAVRWCCLAVAVVCLPAAVYYPPLIFMTIMMGFLTLILSVLASVMAAAVEIREENDLTV